MQSKFVCVDCGRGPMDSPPTSIHRKLRAQAGKVWLCARCGGTPSSPEVADIVKVIENDNKRKGGA